MTVIYFSEEFGGPIYRCDGTSLTSFDLTPYGYDTETLILGPDRILFDRRSSEFPSGNSGGAEIDFDLTTVTNRPALMWQGVELAREDGHAVGVYDPSRNAYWMHLYPDSSFHSSNPITGYHAYWALVSVEGVVQGLYTNNWDGNFYQDPWHPIGAVLHDGYLIWNSDGNGQFFRLNTDTGVTDWCSLMHTDPLVGAENDKFWSFPVGVMPDGRMVIIRRETLIDGAERHYVGLYDMSAQTWSTAFDSPGPLLVDPDVEYPMQGTPEINTMPDDPLRASAGWAGYAGNYVYWFAWEYSVSGPGDHYSIWRLDLRDGTISQFADLDSTDGLGYLGGNITGMVVLEPRPSITGEPLDGRRRFAP